MLDENMKAQLKTLLERIDQQVELVAYLDDSPKSAEMRTLVDEIAALSPVPVLHMIRITAEAIQVEPLLVAPVVASPILLFLLILLMIPPKPKYHSRSDHNEEDDS